MSLLTRWVRFNLVGVAGMVLQLGLVAALNLCWSGHPLATSIFALEATLLHNFLWHVKYTWRIRIGGVAVTRQLIRFHSSNGLVSLTGHVGMIPMFVEAGRLPLVAANGLTIAICSLANFWLSERWAFAEDAQHDCLGRELKMEGSPPAWCVPR